MEWFQIIVSLRDFIRDTLTADGGGTVSVGLGPAAAENSFPAVRLTRNMEPGPKPAGGTEGTALIFVDCSVQTAETDALDAYTKLAALEARIFPNLKRWQQTLPQGIGLAAAVTIEDTMSDEGLTHPIYESRSVVQIKWRK